MGKQVQGEKDDRTVHVVCSSCGHRFTTFGIPMTPEETPPVVDCVHTLNSTGPAGVWLMV